MGSEERSIAVILCTLFISVCMIFIAYFACNMMTYRIMAEKGYIQKVERNNRDNIIKTIWVKDSLD